MKRAGKVLIVLQVIALIMGFASGSLIEMLGSGSGGLFEAVGYLVPGILGIILLSISKRKEIYEQDQRERHSSVCVKCGRQIPANEEFCLHCGARQFTGENTGRNESLDRGSVKNNTGGSQTYEAWKKPKNSILIILGIVVLAFVFVNFLNGNKNEQDSATSGEPVETETENRTNNPEYDKIFKERYIVMAPAFMGPGESTAFVKVDENDMIENIEIGYKNDVIHTLVDHVIFNVSDKTEEEKKSMDESLKENFSGFDFLTVESSVMGKNYYIFTFRVDDLDDKNVVKKLTESQIMQIDTDADFLSAEATRNNLLGSGFIEK